MMRITMTETGGWANVDRRCTVDTAALPRGTAMRLETCVRTLMTAEPRDASRARDAAVLMIEVVDGDVSSRASFSEARPPLEAREVLEILRPHCQPIMNVKP